MANTLNLGTDGNWATKEGSLLGYNSENNNYKPLPFDFTRASNGTFVNKSGLIETAANGVPRIDFLNDSKGALLLEPSRTNNFTDGNNVAETLGVGNATIIQNNNTSPTGTLSAAKFTENTSLSSHFARLGASITGQVAISIFAKADGRNRIYLTQDFNNGVIFNVNTGVVDSYKGSGFTGSIEDYGNGWYRCIVYTTIASVGTLYLVTLLDGSDSTSYTGDGTSSVLLYGSQLEQGSYATSYIPTQGSAVTRVADACDNGGNEQVINSTEGVFYFEGSALADDGTNRFLSLNDGTTSNYIYFRYVSTSNQYLFRTQVGGVTVNTLSGFLTDTTKNHKFAFKFKSGDYAMWVDGVKISTDTSSTIFSANTLSKIEYSFPTNGGDGFQSKTRDLRVYNTALTDAELATLTQV